MASLNKLHISQLRSIANLLGTKNLTRLYSTSKSIRNTMRPNFKNLAGRILERKVGTAYKKYSATRGKRLLKNRSFNYERFLQGARLLRMGVGQLQNGVPVSMSHPNFMTYLQNNPHISAYWGPRNNPLKAFRVGERNFTINGNRETLNLYNQRAINRFFERNPGLKNALSRRR